MTRVIIKDNNKNKARVLFSLSSRRSVMSRDSDGRITSNILNSLPNLGMRSGRQEGACE